MNIDKKTLQKLLGQSDSQLWQTIRMIAAQNGIQLPKEKINEKDMSAIRTALGSATDADIKRALGILDSYRQQ